MLETALNDNQNWIGVLTPHVYIYRLHDGRICLSRCCFGRVISICTIMGWETQTGWTCSNGVSSFLYYKREPDWDLFGGKIYIVYYKLSFSEFENQEVPNLIFMCHILVMGLGFLLTIVVTAGYVAACENIRAPER